MPAPARPANRVQPPAAAPLRALVSRLWVHATAAEGSPCRERALPTGQMHLVMRLSGPPLRVFHGEDADVRGELFTGPVAGGMRTRFHAKEGGGAVVSVGAQLLPGAAMALFGVSAAELSGRHTALADLWGAGAGLLQERLAETPSAALRLALLEEALMDRLHHARAPGLHPVAAEGLRALQRGDGVAAVVRAAGRSHRGFIAMFRQATGLSPKRYAGLQRFVRLLEALHAAPPGLALSALALDHGYSDQAHMTREFRDATGMTPQQYRRLRPAAAHHVTLPVPQADLAVGGGGGGGEGQFPSIHAAG